MFPIDVFQKTLAKVVTIFNLHEIRFHITGGLTGTAYGEPRMTQDIDLVIDPEQTRREIDPFVESLAGSEFMFHEPAVRKAVEEGGMFQLLDKQEALKLDVYPRELIDGELSRSVLFEIFADTLLPVVCRVDAAGSKLIWISKGSHKSRRDLRAIHRNASESQQADIQRLARSLGLETLLVEVLSEPDEIA